MSRVGRQAPRPLAGISLLALITVNGGIKYWLNVYRGVVGERMVRRLRYQLYAAMLRFPLQHFKKTSSGEIIPPIGDGVAELATTTDLEGCEKGQAISDAAASGAPTTVEEPGGVDPCAQGADRAAPTTPAGPPEGEPGRPEPVETPAPRGSGGGADAPGADAKGNGRG